MMCLSVDDVSLSCRQGGRIKKILVISLPGIGDTLMFTPALRVLRNNFPDAHITVLVMFEGAREFLARNLNTDEVLCWEFMKKGLGESLKFILGLRRRKFDLSIIAYPSNRIEYSIINLLIGARFRPVHVYRHACQLWGRWLHHPVIREDDNRHCVMENLELLGRIGLDISSPPSSLDIFLADQDRQAATRFLENRNLCGKRLIGFHPGSNTLKNQINRRWVPERYAALGSLLKSNGDAEILVFGGPEEVALKEKVAAAISPPGLAINGTTLAETAALLEKCSLFVGNDTFLMHLAAALHVPIVGIYGPISHHKDKPYGSRSRIVTRNLDCSPCFFYSSRPLTCYAKRNYACMKTIAVADVFKACSELLDAEETGIQHR
jgi:heptosyltransferase-2